MLDPQTTNLVIVGGIALFGTAWAIASSRRETTAKQMEAAEGLFGEAAANLNHKMKAANGSTYKATVPKEVHLPIRRGIKVCRHTTSHCGCGHASTGSTTASGTTTTSTTAATVEAFQRATGIGSKVFLKAPKGGFVEWHYGTGFNGSGVNLAVGDPPIELDVVAALARAAAPPAAATYDAPKGITITFRINSGTTEKTYKVS